MRVELLGAVEGDRGDGTIGLDDHVLELGHEAASPVVAIGNVMVCSANGAGSMPSSVSCHSVARTVAPVDVEEAERAELRLQVVRVRR